MHIGLDVDKDTAEAIVKAIEDLVESERPVLVDLGDKFPTIRDMLASRHAKLRVAASAIDRQVHPAKPTHFDMRETPVNNPSYGDTPKQTGLGYIGPYGDGPSQWDR